MNLSFKDGVFKKTVSVMGIDVLVKPVEEEITRSGIIVSDVAKSEDTLVSGVIRMKGPGFLFPSYEDSIIENEQKTKTRYVELDVQEGDLVYYLKKHATYVTIDSQTFVLVPYPALRLRIRESLEDTI